MVHFDSRLWISKQSFKGNKKRSSNITKSNMEKSKQRERLSLSLASPLQTSWRLNNTPRIWNSSSPWGFYSSDLLCAARATPPSVVFKCSKYVGPGGSGRTNRGCWRLMPSGIKSSHQCSTFPPVLFQSTTDTTRYLSRRDRRSEASRTATAAVLPS